jgi:TM2 domain-containing membrane protein YozV
VTIQNPGEWGNSPELRATMAQSEFQAAQKSAAAAYLLCIFFGVFGVHRFYLGRNGSGLAMLLITVLTVGFGVIVTGIWALVDLFLIGGLLREVNQRILTGIWQRYGIGSGANSGAPIPGPMPIPGQIPGQTPIPGQTGIPGQIPITGQTQIPGQMGMPGE